MPPYQQQPVIPSLRQHLQDLVSRENYGLLGAVEALSAVLESAAVLSHKAFPDLRPQDPQFREATIALAGHLVGMLPQSEEDGAADGGGDSWEEDDEAPPGGDDADGGAEHVVLVDRPPSRNGG